MPDAMPDPDIEKLKQFLALMPQPAATPAPALPVGSDPAVAQQAIQDKGANAALHSLAGLQIATPFTVRNKIDTSPKGHPGYDVAQEAANLPVQQEQARATLSNDQAGILNKWQEANAGRQTKLGVADLAAMSKFVSTQGQQTIAQGKNQTALTVATGHDKAKVDAAHVTAGDAAGSIAPDIKRKEAQRYRTTGTVQTPKGLRGAAARAFVTDVMNMADEMDKEPGAAPAKPLAAAAADYGADKASQAALQRQSDTTNALEDTASRNLDVFLGTAKTVTDTGSPLLNKGARWLDENSGDPNIAAFRAARQTAVGEIAKVLNASGSNMTDSLRHEVSGLIGPDATGAQIVSAAQILKKDMANRRAANQGQIDAVKGRISGQPQSHPKADPVALEQKARARLAADPNDKWGNDVLTALGKK